MVNKICVYAICKNELQFVDRWVNSMSEADEIIVYDTGSTDGTYEKLKEFGVNVKQGVVDPWRFDDARNRSLEMAYETDCNIFVCTDFDEYFLEGWSDCLREKWDDSLHIRGHYRYDWAAKPDNGADVLGFIYDKIHCRGWRWKYPCHEALVMNDDIHYSYDNICHLPEDRVHLIHTQDFSKPRTSYLDLLKLRYEEDSNDIYGLMYLSREYAMHNLYSESTNIAKEAIEKFSDRYTPMELSRMWLYIAENYWDESDLDRAIYYCQKAHAADKLAREPLVHAARIYIQKEDYEIAKGLLLQALRDSVNRHSWCEINSYWTWETYNWLSVACYYTNDYEHALKWASMALDAAPKLDVAKHNIKVAIEGIKNARN